jgi:hypothetical protein
MRCLPFTAILCVAILTQLFATPVTAESAEAGIWMGTVDQPGSDPYEMIMELDGQGGGRTDYPDLSCSGILTGEPGAYFEIIISNRATKNGDGDCIDGNISVSVSGDRMDWQWSGSWLGDSYEASATLFRQGRSNAPHCADLARQGRNDQRCK